MIPADTPAVDLDAIRAKLAQVDKFHYFSKDEVRALLGMVDTLTAALKLLYGAHAETVMDTAEDEALRAQVLAKARDLVPGIDAALAGTSPTPPTRDLAALADQWSAKKAAYDLDIREGRGVVRVVPKDYAEGIADCLGRCASELRAALGGAPTIHRCAHEVCSHPAHVGGAPTTEPCDATHEVLGRCLESWPHPGWHASQRGTWPVYRDRGDTTGGGA